MTDKTSGYLIKNKYGEYLSSKLFWFRDDSYYSGWVHPKDILIALKNIIGSWKIKAVHAEYDGNSVKIIGDEFIIDWEKY